MNSIVFKTWRIIRNIGIVIMVFFALFFIVYIALNFIGIAHATKDMTPRELEVFEFHESVQAEDIIRDFALVLNSDEETISDSIWYEVDEFGRIAKITPICTEWFGNVYVYTVCKTGEYALTQEVSQNFFYMSREILQEEELSVFLDKNSFGSEETEDEICIDFADCAKEYFSEEKQDAISSLYAYDKDTYEAYNVVSYNSEYALVYYKTDGDGEACVLKYSEENNEYKTESVITLSKTTPAEYSQWLCENYWSTWADYEVLP